MHAPSKAEMLVTACALKDAEIASLREDLSAMHFRSLRRKKHNRRLRKQLEEALKAEKEALASVELFQQKTDLLTREVLRLREQLAKLMVEKDLESNPLAI